jgi:hypothetical protein
MKEYTVYAYKQRVYVVTINATSESEAEERAVEFLDDCEDIDVYLKDSTWEGAFVAHD